jgi:hypothetical protein
MRVACAQRLSFGGGFAPPVETSCTYAVATTCPAPVRSLPCSVVDLAQCLAAVELHFTRPLLANLCPALMLLCCTVDLAQCLAAVELDYLLSCRQGWGSVGPLAYIL